MIAGMRDPALSPSRQLSGPPCGGDLLQKPVDRSGRCAEIHAFGFAEKISHAVVSASMAPACARFCAAARKGY